MERPSILAASSKSLGIPLMNWTFRKMKKPCPKNCGTMIGRYVPIHPSLLNMMYWGIMMTWKGSIIDTNMQANQKFLNLKLQRANPNAMMVEESTAPNVETMEIKNEFLKKIPNEKPAKPFHPVMKLWRENDCGRSVCADVNISELVLKEPSIIQITGKIMT